jgi:hypothetical protein
VGIVTHTMGNEAKVKYFRDDIRQRYMNDREALIKEFHEKMQNADRRTRRLYLVGLEKLLFDLANGTGNNQRAQ